MAPRELSFIHRRGPRAAGLSDEAVDEHKELIGNLYLDKNYTRDQVIDYLKTDKGFSLSPDQFSKATGRWGFYKQRRGGVSIQPSPIETTSQSATSETTSNELSSTTSVEDSTDREPILANESSKRPRSVASSISPTSDITAHGTSSPLPRRPVKRPRPRSNAGDSTAESPSQTQPDLAIDGDFAFAPSTEETSIESNPLWQNICDDELSAEYLACCYQYTKAFNYYYKISVPFQYKTSSAKQRRARMLDMARTAKTRRTCEIVRAMMEFELKTSRDPLNGERSPDGAEMCHMQSFQFHRHLAQIPAHRSYGSLRFPISTQKHSDKARSFIKTFDKYGPALIDLWTLLYLHQEKKDHHISEDLLTSLKFDEGSLQLDMTDCLTFCWGALTQTEPLLMALRDHVAGQREKMNPTVMSNLSAQNNPLYIWKKVSLLFTFFWKEMQLVHGARFTWGLRTISPTCFLLVVSRIIVQRSLLIPSHSGWSLDSEEQPLELQESDKQLYRGVVIELFHENLFPPNQIKREFVTRFVEHHSWSPSVPRKSVLAQQIRTYQMGALGFVLATKRSRRPYYSPSMDLTEVTTLKARNNEIRRASPDNEFLSWLMEQQEQLDSTSQRETIIYIQRGRYSPSLYSSSNSSYLRTSLSAHHIYLNTSNGNPTISRSLTSHSSPSSELSVSSSLRRFKKAALCKLKPTVPKPRERIYSLSRLGHDGTSELSGWDDFFQEVQDFDDFKGYMNRVPVLEEEEEEDDLGVLEEVSEDRKSDPELSMGEDGKPTVRSKIGRLLKGKGKADLVSL